MEINKQELEKFNRIKISGPNKECTFDIWFDDLKPEIQKQILEAAKIDSPADANWHVFPITEIFLGDEYDGN